MTEAMLTRRRLTRHRDRRTSPSASCLLVVRVAAAARSCRPCSETSRDSSQWVSCRSSGMRFRQMNFVGVNSRLRVARSGVPSAMLPSAAGARWTSRRFSISRRALHVTAGSQKLILQSHEHFPDPSFRAYCERLGQVYHAIREVSGCSVIVDSTKSPPSAMLLRKVPHIDLRVVHLVRDSRGVAFSWNKSDIENIQYREHPILKGRPMPTMRPSESALWWDIKNLLLHAFIPIDQRLLVHYERLTSKPTEELRRILHFVDVNEMPTSTKINLGTTFTSMPFHTLGGNPLRFARGNIDVHVDTTWRARMPLAQKAIVSGLTFPLLAAYGYLDGPWERLRATMLSRCLRKAQRAGRRRK